MNESLLISGDTGFGDCVMGFIGLTSGLDDDGSIVDGAGKYG